jgi:flagellar basal body rod protein FlgG
MSMDYAAAAFRKIERQQEVVANNLANANTTGFKAERLFSHLLAADGTPAFGTVTDRAPGALTVTNAPLDVASEGQGFFVVATPTGEQLVRGGAWQVDADGRLTDGRGALVLGEAGPEGIIAGPITVPRDASALRIEADGRVFADGTLRGKLRMEDVPPDVALEHAGDGRFVAPAARRPMPDDARRIRQGALEESNVSSIGSLVSLIDIQRAYGAVQRAVSVIDAARGVIAGDIARPN